MTTGASLNPDSASSRPASRGGRGARRSTEKSAAASVEETTAPRSIPVSQSTSSSQWAEVPMTTTETAVPSVASSPAGAIAVLTDDQRVVSPPSARMTTSAATPRVWVSA